jgi:hypothetical protein
MAMKNSFLVSVAAAALFATTGLAAAQGMNPGGAKGGESPAAASPTRESASPSMSKDTSPSMAKESPGSEAKPGSSAQDKTGTKAMPQQAQDKSAPAMDKKSSTQTSGEMNKDTKSTSPAGSKTSAETPAAGTTKNGAAAETKSGTQTTTGNAATSATAAPPAEKRSQIVSAIKSEKVEEVTNVNFNISVGTAVPASVHYYPLPPRIVEIYPEWRGYDFILVRGRYIILRPETHEIVYIIEG